MSCTAKLQTARRELRSAHLDNLRCGNRVVKLELHIEDAVRAYKDSEMSNFDDAKAQLEKDLGEI